MRASIALMLLGLAFAAGSIYLPAGLWALAGCGFVLPLGIHIGGMILMLIGMRLERSEEKLFRETPDREGFLVVQPAIKSSDERRAGGTLDQIDPPSRTQEN